MEAKIKFDLEKVPRLEEKLKFLKDLPIELAANSKDTTLIIEPDGLESSFKLYPEEGVAVFLGLEKIKEENYGVISAVNKIGRKYIPSTRIFSKSKRIENSIVNIYNINPFSRGTKKD